VIQERRRAPRYRIDATIAVDGGTGRAIDLSSNSVYFESDRQFAPGETIALVFPLERTGPGASVNCSAEVVRVDRRGDAFGVAAVYEPISFSVSPETGA
jgi:hypothetical protein